MQVSKQEVIRVASLVKKWRKNLPPDSPKEFCIDNRSWEKMNEWPRLLKETYWMHRLKTLSPNGMNTKVLYQIPNT